MYNLNEITKPIIFKNKIADWPASQWIPKLLETMFGSNIFTYRIGNKTSQFESSCDYINGTIKDFNEWCDGVENVASEFFKYPNNEFWCYFDYKYMAELFADQPDLLNSVNWSTFGFLDRNGQQSTMWVGSKGANTACHQDTYGYNLVAQIYGHKRWILFSPSDNKYLYPTRVPYEESSVYSQVNISTPNLKTFPCFQGATPFVATLEPGDVLLVPHNWWHYVESLDTTISINTWIELPSDDMTRLKESITRTLLFPIMNEYQYSRSGDNDEQWLNPNETYTSLEENYNLLQSALNICRKNSSNKRKRSNDLNDVNNETSLHKRMITNYHKLSFDNCIENINSLEYIPLKNNVINMEKTKQMTLNSMKICASTEHIKDVTETIISQKQCVNKKFASVTNILPSKQESSNIYFDTENIKKYPIDSRTNVKAEIGIDSNKKLSTNYENVEICNKINAQNISSDLFEEVKRFKFEEYLNIVGINPIQESSEKRNFEYNDFINIVTNAEVIQLIANKMLNE